MKTPSHLRKTGIFTFSLLAIAVAAPWANAAPQNQTQKPAAEVASNSSVEEVVVTSRRESDYSVITEQGQKIIEVPGALGDPLMAVFSLPGVLGKGDGGAPAVRGSSPSDNRYMVDGAPAGYAFHQFSTSIFNENIIQDFQLYSAGFGPSYADAIGGVFDIRLRDPKHQNFTTKLDLGMLRAGIFLESEVTENSAFYLSARSSLLQYFVSDQQKKDAEKEEGIKVKEIPQDTDYQFKYLMEFDGGNKLTLSANGATDLASASFNDQAKEVQEQPDFAGEAKLQNNFANETLAWSHASTDGGSLRDRVSMELRAGHYRNENNTFWGNHQYNFDITQDDNYLIGQLGFAVAKSHNITLGGELHKTEYEYDAKYVQYVCTETDPDCALRRGNLIVDVNTVKVTETMGYINDHWNVTDNFSFDMGGQVHANNLTQERLVEPRVAASWKLSNDWTINSAAGKYDRLPDIDKIFPVVGNPKLKSPTSNHYTLGLKHTFGDGWSWTTTAYSKTMEKLPLANAVGADPIYTNQTSGRAYGLELFVNKELTNHWYGWLALSTSRSFRRNDLTKKETPYYLDTPVVINAVMNYKVGSWTMGGRLTAHTGEAYTPILGAQANPYFADHWLPVYGEAYSKNLPYYGRLDLRVKKDTTFWHHKGEWTIDVLNATNQQNVEDRRLDYKKTTSASNYKLKDDVGLGIILAAGMSITF